ncbi:uncharacterized protein OCT59_009281 [Rhizophagus irregularis]|uniref:Uncharacterized protein n=1 Tax=Rhizophagus irregularis (strain DAOM 197198w) TaxID=1432141 RepID=A0A015LYT8_RHIIW|nr:hypothetical protein RirG_019810 [Rhizophagus irregularis DAOM 197198w]UZO17952.1 hypothetical protein OCT59_009281 [Rhizophagus irregularis]GET59391.1 hypothetical protein GLOIN_2v1784920 [Rhizophagus irregularis DAOM 181602=DAOM 197198]
MDKIEVETQNNTSTSEMKDDTFKKHRKSIIQIKVSLYINEEYDSDDYVVTYSYEDRSVLGWSVNIENNGPQQPDVYFKVDQIAHDLNYYYALQTLSKKILLLRSLGDNWLIDLNSDHTSSDRFLKLKHQVDYATIGFLPNGDLIQVSLGDRKIYKYCFTEKPKNTVPWEYSQIIDIEIPESLNGQVEICSIYRTKLFLIVGDTDCKMLQFDLLTMNLERKYTEFTFRPWQITMNKNQKAHIYIYIYSMENGMLIYKNEDNAHGVQFITLKNTERLFIYHKYGGKLVDPYQVYDEIVVSDGINGITSVITKLNRKIFIENGNVCVTDGINGIDENKLQQLSNNTSYIYTLPIFKIIQSMLNEIIDQVDIKKVVDKVEINKNLWIEDNDINFRHD